MAAKSKKQHGFRVTATVFFPYDPAKPETITSASSSAIYLGANIEKASNGGVIVEKISDPAPATINAPVPATAEG